MESEVYLGDCYEIIKSIPTNSVDLIITDPPYDIDAGIGGGSFGTSKRDYHSEYTKLSRDNHLREGLRIIHNSNQLGKNIRAICGGFDYSLLDELDRVMKKINIYIWCNKNQIRSLMEHYEKKGCNVDLLVRYKTNPIPTCNSKYLSDLEYCVFARDKGVKLYGTYKTKSKVYISKANVEDKKKFKHPTIKPLERIKEYIINSSVEGEVILDPFFGSGTTGVAAKELKRKFIGIEINEEYYRIACDRLKGIDANGSMDLLSYQNEE